MEIKVLIIQCIVTTILVAITIWYAIETRRMANSSSNPSVSAGLEFDYPVIKLHLINSGASPAYEIKVEVDDKDIKIAYRSDLNREFKNTITLGFLPPKQSMVFALNVVKPEFVGKPTYPGESRNFLGSGIVIIRTIYKNSIGKMIEDKNTVFNVAEALNFTPFREPHDVVASAIGQAARDLISDADRKRHWDSMGMSPMGTGNYKMACPMCGESIKKSAKKCPHCLEFIKIQEGNV